jgi:hypothetical protein
MGSILVRRGEVLAMGIGRRALDQLRKAKLLVPVRLRGRKREVYLRQDVLRMIGGAEVSSLKLQKDGEGGKKR